MTLHIALEGIDNCGKSTLAENLANSLNNSGRRALVSKEFISAYGTTLKERLYSHDNHPSSNEKVLAFALDRLIRYENILKSDHDVIVWDRFTLSAIVYRTVEGLDKQWVSTVNQIFPIPDLYLYIDVTPEISVIRGSACGKGCPYNHNFLQNCRNEYLNYVASGVLHNITSTTVDEQLLEVIEIINARK